MPTQKRPAWLPDIDLRPVTRDVEHVETTIEVRVQHEFHRWLILGALSHLDLDRKVIQVSARLRDDATDEEHDSSYAFVFEVSLLELRGVHGGTVELGGVISGSDEDCESLQVPSQPFASVAELPDATPCPDCEGEEAHFITSFVPSTDRALWQRLRGREIRICIGPVPSSDPLRGRDPV